MEAVAGVKRAPLPAHFLAEASGRGGGSGGGGLAPPVVMGIGGTADAEEGGRGGGLDASQHIHTLEVMPLGGGNEVGRSCHLLRYRGKTIMLDCGILPSFTGQKALPYLSEVDPASVDIIIITHFHLDHCAALPYFTERLAGFRGRIFATHPTIAVMRMLLADFIRVSVVEARDPEGLYTARDIERCLARMEAVDLHTRLDVDGVKLAFYNAGHVLGAAMVLIDIARVRVLYTGDYSFEEDRHLMAAEVPRDPVDVLIVEATHGMSTMDARPVREKQFTDAVEAIVRRGGRCLIPVFALGRTQELMLILDELWEAKPDLQAIPLLHANNMAAKGACSLLYGGHYSLSRPTPRPPPVRRRCAGLEVYRTYVSYMNRRIQAAMGAGGEVAGTGGGGGSGGGGSSSGGAVRNPWDFRHLKHIRGQEDFRVRAYFPVRTRT